MAETKAENTARGKIKMANMAQLERMLGKAILDRDFRKKLLDEPEDTAKSLGIDLSPAQVAPLRNLDPKLVDWWADGFEIARGQGQGFLW